MDEFPGTERNLINFEAVWLRECWEAYIEIDSRRSRIDRITEVTGGHNEDEVHL